MESLAKALLFPDAKAFTDLFERWSYKKEEVAARSFAHQDLLSSRRRHFQVPVGPYCAVDAPNGHFSLYVEPKADVVERLRAGFIGSARESLFFKVVVREDGALVIASNNLILATRWLALLPVSEIPNPPPEAVE